MAEARALHPREGRGPPASSGAVAMALTDDQRALLRLLLAGDSYEQVASVLGSSTADTRARAHAAADALAREPDPELSATAVAERLDELEHGSPAPPAPPPRARPALPQRLLWAIGAGAVAVLALVLALTVLGGDDEGDDEAPSADREEAITIELSPVAGRGASGAVTIIRLGDQPALDLAIRGLESSGPDETYVLWFVGSGDRSLPIAFRPVGSAGEISGRATIPSAAVGLLPSFDSVELTLTPKQAAAAAIRESAESGTLPERAGEVVLRGVLPG